MKKILLCCLSLCCMTATMKAQRYYGQWNCNLSGTYAPDEYGARIGTEKSFGYTYSALRAEVAFTNKRKEIPAIPDVHANIHSYSLSLGYVYSMEKYTPHAFYFNPSAGAFIGIEHFRGNLPIGIIRTKNNHFLMGFYFLVQAEIKLSSKISVFIEPVGNYRLRTSQDNFSFHANLGFKLYLPR